MKKFGFVIAALALALGANAQEKTANQYENEGNAFVQEKKFQQALESYEQAYAMKGDSISPKTLFNAGICAQKTNAYDKALDFYTKTEALDYRPAESAYRAAAMLRAQKNTDAYVEKLTTSIEKYSSDKKFCALMRKDLAKHYRDQGLKLFNEGADVTKKFAANNANQDKLAELKEEAKSKFNEALPFVEKALEVNPEDAGAKQIKEGIEKQLANL